MVIDARTTVWLSASASFRGTALSRPHIVVLVTCGLFQPAGPKEAFTRRQLAFVYGTLKRGFGNYWLMEDMVQQGTAHFLGTARTQHRYPLVCGPFQVPFMLNNRDEGHHVKGEVYSISNAGVERLDELEGVDKGHYKRLAIALRDLHVTASELHPEEERLVAAAEAQAYFAYPSYSDSMAAATDEHIDAYTEREAATYIKRSERPGNKTFLEHVQCWIEERCDDLSDGDSELVQVCRVVSREEREGRE
ncbi:hypothetical protein KFL_003680140 [Klebsormidium nitens]|uniref:Gamma-glutamylcyclotransferase family protein n=1 Tax=Klebsormidium nitens TaxID=105231 RepID=A0A1Y1I9K9_KLENI|nr:hypothetical protein KFL_003680140 [Klebsormidium nitens]|eukprot:GAQ87664.1 hypothetical protein KFL_003680140 [Klebsormidium nitens]